MEGFLFKKGRGDGGFGRRTWKKRWFVLEQQQLTYFEDIDLQTGNPVSQKGSMSVVDCTVAPYPHHEKQNTFVIKSPNESDLIVQAPDARLLGSKRLIIALFSFSWRLRTVIC
jgi:hypothetical protein